MPIGQLPLKALLVPLWLALQLFAQEGPDPWERVRRFDANNDGKISRDEFQGPRQMFERMDANRDGTVTREEAMAARRQFVSPPREGFGPGSGGPGVLARIDANNDERVSLQEWNDFFKKADENGDEVLQSEEWQAAIRQQPFNDPAPAVGTRVPKLKVHKLNSRQEIDLSAPRRTTVLVFGSYT